jgi:uncharacterized protein
VMSAIVDTGPLVAFFDRAERHHRWIAQPRRGNRSATPRLRPGAHRSAISARALSEGTGRLFELLQNGALSIVFRIEEHVGALRRLLQKYRDSPMSLADACVVRMAEIYDRHAVLTLDSDFSVYRKHGRVPLTLIHPAMRD